MSQNGSNATTDRATQDHRTDGLDSDSPDATCPICDRESKQSAKPTR